MPSSTAARVALSASSTRSFFSLTSTSVEPPTLDHRHTAGELRLALLELLLVVIRGGILDLLFDLGNAGLNIGILPSPTDNRGVLLV